MRLWESVPQALKVVIKPVLHVEPKKTGLGRGPGLD